MDAKTFVLNDENVVNCYGFRVRNAGLDFSDFDPNPVMLADHVNETGYVRGNWLNRRFEGTRLLMDANFDTELPEGKTLAGQVERNFVKGASLGLYIDFDGPNVPFEKQPDGNWDLLTSKVKEGSVCAVPGNSGALALYNATTGKQIAESDIKLAMAKLSAGDIDFKQHPNKMPEIAKITLSAGANSVLLGLGVADNSDAMQISAALVKLHADFEDEKKAHNLLKEQRKAELKAQATALVDAAIADEKILGGEREEWLTFAESNLALATTALAKLKGKSSLELAGPGGAMQSSPNDPKTIDDFEKMPDNAKLAFKTNHPDKYKALFQ